MSATSTLAIHAARRLTFGATPSVVADIERQGLAAWVDGQLAGLPDVHGEVAGLGAGSTPLPYAALHRLDGRDLLAELRQATFARAAFGDAQLAELLVEFWTNHLSIAGDVVGVHKVVDDRDVVRRHALGAFSDLLVASAHSPAMLLYLDNASSRGAAPNENYARELLELHTVGVHGGFQQRDVRDAAKVLTGLTVDEQTGEFLFRPEWHATGPVRVLGWSHDNADASRGDEVATSMLRYLAGHPRTATHLATKLVRRLVDDTPPASLVGSAAQVFLDSGTDVVPVLRHIVLSREFAAASGRKTQRGLEWAALAVRSLRLAQDPRVPVDGSRYVALLSTLGQVPFGWVPPDGYPDGTLAWSSTASTLARWNAAQQLVAGRVGGLQPLDVDALVGTPVPTTTGALVDQLTSRMLCAPASSRTRAALVRSTGREADRGVDRATVRRLTPALAALVLSSPEAQVR